MQLPHARAAIAEVFRLNGFSKWAEQAGVETDWQQLRRLAIRAVNTSPAAERENVAINLRRLIG